MAEPDPPPRFHQVLTPDPTELGIVANQIGQLAPLLDEVAAGQAVDLLLEPVGPEQLAEDETGIVEAERLIEIRRHEKMPLNRNHGVPARLSRRASGLLLARRC